MKRVFIIHGWSGSPKNDWLPWLADHLKNKGFEVITPAMPKADFPKIKPWVNKLNKVAAMPKNDDIFIGHSIGCQAILRFLESLDDSCQVDKVILVAPWLKLTNLESDEEKKIAQPWLKNPLDFNKVKSKAKTFVTMFSNNDPYVPLKANTKMFKQKLNPKIVIQKNKGHFTQDDGVVKIPEIVEFILSE